MKKAVIYTKSVCPYCAMAKKLLSDNGIAYSEVLIQTEEQMKDMQDKTNGAKTVPQIFIDDEYIGNYDSLRAAINNGTIT